MVDAHAGIFFAAEKNGMNQRMVQVALVVADYDEAIRYYVGVLGFELIEDTAMSETKRWVVVKPKGTGIFTL